MLRNRAEAVSEDKEDLKRWNPNCSEADLSRAAELMYVANVERMTPSDDSVNYRKIAELIEQIEKLAPNMEWSMVVLKAETYRSLEEKAGDSFQKRIACFTHAIALEAKQEQITIAHHKAIATLYS